MVNTENGGKILFKLNEVKPIADKIAGLLEPHCDLLAIAGSIRREKPLVGDIEILYVPKIEEETPEGELLPKRINKSEQKIKELIEKNILEHRIKKDGTMAFGQKIKLLRVKDSQVPLDLFACKANQWANNLVSRTGGKETNITIASRAKHMGWNWLPFGAGFQNSRTKQTFQPKSEREVFEFVKLNFKHFQEPKNRL